ncbi:hypothetical protein CK203_075054 [Vitis vinifera]|uniref:Uncharacterized protein n=1 Tax=Vitis vinifera TaxID=29760 RepID=A0A438F9K0_VITVI|nr:hypothetical protein CK203_075054 [Vitis vinifera]
MILSLILATDDTLILPCAGCFEAVSTLRVSRSPHSAGHSPSSPRGTPSRSISKSVSNSGSYLEYVSHFSFFQVE